MISTFLLSSWTRHRKLASSWKIKVKQTARTVETVTESSKSTQGWKVSRLFVKSAKFASPDLLTIRKEWVRVLLSVLQLNPPKEQISSLHYLKSEQFTRTYNNQLKPLLQSMETRIHYRGRENQHSFRVIVRTDE